MILSVFVWLAPDHPKNTWESSIKRIEDILTPHIIHLGRLTPQLCYVSQLEREDDFDLSPYRILVHYQRISLASLSPHQVLDCLISNLYRGITHATLVTKWQISSRDSCCTNCELVTDSLSYVYITNTESQINVQRCYALVSWPSTPRHYRAEDRHQHPIAENRRPIILSISLILSTIQPDRASKWKAGRTLYSPPSNKRNPW